MTQDKTYIDELITKYLAGEALPDEAMELEDWRNASAMNHDYVTEAEKIYRITHKLPEPKEVDTYDLFAKVQAQITVPPKQNSRVIHLKNYFTPLRALAAVLVLGVGVMFMLYISQRTNKNLSVYESGNGVLHQKLADGTQVELQAHTKLELVGGNKRKLRMSGEATFNVVHNESDPFMIEAGGIQIKDIGTVFTVKAISGSDSVRVHVSEGIVQMFSVSDTIELHQQQEGLYIRSAQRLINLSEKKMNEEAKRVFHFSNSTLKEAVEMINAAYPEKISLANSELEKCLITVDFNGQPIEVVVTILAETLGLSFDKIPSGYRLKGTACLP
ncbi:MAG: FecR domain-containing protein [Bacteroidia bacterium]|nr:FecR domain-containing protein [Bacteroidia bacterium]